MLILSRSLSFHALSHSACTHFKTRTVRMCQRGMVCDQIFLRVNHQILALMNFCCLKMLLFYLCESFFLVKEMCWLGCVVYTQNDGNILNFMHVNESFQED